MPYLLVQKGPHAGQKFRLDRDQILLGRDKDCHLVLDSTDAATRKNAVSRQHAVITCNQGVYYIEDGNAHGKKSRNGTFLNGAPVLFPQRALLRNNDLIKICHVTLAYLEDEEPSSSTIEASLSHDSSSFFAQPAERLRLLLDISNQLGHSLELNALLPQVVETLLQLFKQADRAFLILLDEASGALIPRSIKTRRPQEESMLGFSRSIVQQCLDTVGGLLCNDAGREFPDSESVMGLALRSVMCAPLWTQEQKAFGVLLVDSHQPKTKFNQEDLNLLMGVASQASIALDNARYHRAALARERLSRDLALARQVQRSFLPEEIPEIPGYDFFAVNQSALEVGGDYYDFIHLPGPRIGVMLGDVAGKGVAAALVMARFSAGARACVRAEPSLAAAVADLNLVMQPLGRTDRFVTLAALLLDPATHTLSVVDAGHPSPLLLRQATGILEDAAPQKIVGPPLGILEGLKYETQVTKLEPGDSVVLFSDGITDALNVDGRQFGLAALRALLAQGNAAPNELGERILQAVAKHASGCGQQDDITLVCLRRLV